MHSTFRQLDITYVFEVVHDLIRCWEDLLSSKYFTENNNNINVKDIFVTSVVRATLHNVSDICTTSWIKMHCITHEKRKICYLYIHSHILNDNNNSYWLEDFTQNMQKFTIFMVDTNTYFGKTTKF